MSAQGHTPGPWIVHPVAAHVMSSEIDGDGDLIPVCAMLWPTELRSEAVTQANASLIAASPDLLATLEAVAECMLNGGDGVTGDFGWRISGLTKLRPQIRAAIANARGAA